MSLISTKVSRLTQIICVAFFACGTCLAAPATTPPPSDNGSALVAKNVAQLDDDLNQFRTYNRHVKAFDDYSLSGLQFLQQDTAHVASINQLDVQSQTAATSTSKDSLLNRLYPQCEQDASICGIDKQSDIHELLAAGKTAKVGDYQNFAQHLYDHRLQRFESQSLVNDVLVNVGHAHTQQDNALKDLVNAPLKATWVQTLSTASPTTVSRVMAMEQAVGNYLKYQTYQQNQLIMLELATQLAQQQKIIDGLKKR